MRFCCIHNFFFLNRLILVFYSQIFTPESINILASTIPTQNESNRMTKSMFDRVLYPKSKTQSTTNHHISGIHNSFGVSGNVGIGLHFGSGYRIKNGDGKHDQQIVHNKIYDKYLGTSFGFGSLGGINKGHENDVEQSVSEDQHATFQENNFADQPTVDQENNLADQDNEIIPVTTQKPKSGVFKKISNYWTSEHSEPKNSYTSNGLFKWSMQKFKNKNNVGTPR